MTTILLFFRENFEVMSNAKIRTPQISKQKGSEALPVRSECAGVRADSQFTEHQQIGISGKNRKGRTKTLLFTFHGGILNRLIQQAVKDIENAKESIEWYKREKIRAEQDLAELLKLQSDMENELQTETSTESE